MVSRNGSLNSVCVLRAFLKALFLSWSVVLLFYVTFREGVIVVWDSWEAIECSKRDILAVVDVRDLSVALFSSLPREIHIGVCWQSVSLSVYKKLLDVSFILGFPVEDNCFIYSTADGANRIIFNGSTIEFDFSTLSPVIRRISASSL